jgi:major vault protein
VSYLKLKAQSLEVEKSGQAVAEARSKARADQIKWDSKVAEVENEVKAKKIEYETELTMEKARQDAEITHKRALNDLEVTRARQLAEIETEKFQQVIESVGRDTIVSMAKAGPEFQNRMMKGLGLKGFMIMNSKNPINLFNTAAGFTTRPS